MGEPLTSSDPFHTYIVSPHAWYVKCFLGSTRIVLASALFSKEIQTISGLTVSISSSLNSVSNLTLKRGFSDFKTSIIQTLIPLVPSLVFMFTFCIFQRLLKLSMD